MAAVGRLVELRVADGPRDGTPFQLNRRSRSAASARRAHPRRHAGDLRGLSRPRRDNPCNRRRMLNHAATDRINRPLSEMAQLHRFAVPSNSAPVMGTSEYGDVQPAHRPGIQMRR